MGASARMSGLITALAAGLAVAAGSLAVSAVRTEHRETVAEDRRDLDAITTALRHYGVRHDRWDGVGSVVADLSAVAGRRIRITTESGAPVADSGAPAGGVKRPALGQTVLVRAQPELALPAGRSLDAPAVTGSELWGLRRGSALSTCLGTAGIPVEVVPGPYGVPRLTAAAGTPPAAVRGAMSRCRAAVPRLEDVVADTAAIHRCTGSTPTSPDAQTRCLGRVFAERSAALSADPVLLSLGPQQGRGPLPVTRPAGLAVVALLLAASVTVSFGRMLAGRMITAWRGRGDLHQADWEQMARMSRSVDKLTSSMEQREQHQRRQLAHVAHELRNPLTNMRAYLEALSDGVIPPEPRLFALLQEEAMLQQRIIDDLRQQVEAEDGGLTYRRVVFDFGELVEICWLAHLPAADAAGIRLTAVTDGYLPVNADPDRFRQVVGNLVGNALRYTPAGGAVEIRTRYDDGRALLQVADTGIGIEAGDLHRVFDAGWRSAAALGRSGTGSGLGLSISRQIIADHGGTIAVDSRVGHGTTFTVFVPLAHRTVAVDGRAGGPAGGTQRPSAGARQ